MLKACWETVRAVRLQVRGCQFDQGKYKLEDAIAKSITDDSQGCSTERCMDTTAVSIMRSSNLLGLLLFYKPSTQLQETQLTSRDRALKILLPAALCIFAVLPGHA